MKRTISLVLTLMLVLSIVCGASAAGETFKTAYFTLTLPSGWFEDTSEAESKADEDGIQYLGCFGEDKDFGFIVEAYLVCYDELKEVSLWNADEAELKDYVDAVMEDFADDDPEYLGIVMACSIPFVLIRGTDEEGEYLYADTMTNGYAIEMFVYLADENGESQYPISKEYIEQFKSILETFQPVS